MNRDVKLIWESYANKKEGHFDPRIKPGCICRIQMRQPSYYGGGYHSDSIHDVSHHWNGELVIITRMTKDACAFDFLNDRITRKDHMFILTRCLDFVSDKIQDKHDASILGGLLNI